MLFRSEKLEKELEKIEKKKNKIFEAYEDDILTKEGTHDLALGTLADEFPDKIRNYRFEASIEHDQLTFSYQMQTGIAQNMNACFLMKQMGITLD